MIIINDTGGYVRDAKELAILQSYPLWLKVRMSQERIRDWVYHYGENGVVISFSGGKDSTALLHLVRKEFPDIKAVFSNTGLEYPEIQRFVKSFDNVDIVTPKMRFDEVISTYGYPLISKEVAEAIYYARRIRSQDVNVERERAVQASNSTSAQSFAERGQQDTPCKTIPYGEVNWKRLEIGGAEPQESGDQRFAHDRRELQQTTTSRGSRAGRISNGNYEPSPAWYAFESGKRDRLLLNGFKTGVAIDVGGEKSQFNKEKWKPLVYLPIPISHMCCQKLKKQPIKAYQHKNDLCPFLGTLAEESRIRKQAWIRHGCNAFDSKSPTSQPLSFWTEQDILRYIVENDLQIASVYGVIVAVDGDGNEYPANSLLIDGCKLKCTGCDRTGCLYCGFGFHNEKGITRFQRLAQTHPRQYEYCIGGGQWVDNPHYDPTAPKMDGDWQNWNPKKIWVPSKNGLGMGKVFDMVNEIYGKNFFRYE